MLDKMTTHEECPTALPRLPQLRRRPNVIECLARIETELRALRAEVAALRNTTPEADHEHD